VWLSKHARKAVERKRGGIRVFKEVEVDRAALLVMDMQNAFCEPSGIMYVQGVENIVQNINKLVEECRGLKIPVFWIRHLNLPDGSDWPLYYNYFTSPQLGSRISRELSEDSWGSKLWRKLNVDERRDYFVNKRRYSPFISGSSSLERLLRGMNRDTIILTGVKTNICVESTARDAMMLDFKVIVVSDATAASTEEEHRCSLSTLIQSFADVMSTDEVIKLLRKEEA